MKFYQRLKLGILVAKDICWYNPFYYLVALFYATFFKKMYK